MHQDAVFMGVRLRGRFLAVALVFLFALSFGCSIGATAFADEVKDLEFGMLDSPLVLDEDVGECAVITGEIAPPNRCEFRADADFAVIAMAPVVVVEPDSPLRPSRVAYRACRPTGPPAQRA
jgi:hypothetical protein